MQEIYGGQGLTAKRPKVGKREKVQCEQGACVLREKLETGFQKRCKKYWRSRTDSKEAKGGKERESAVGTGSLCPKRGDAEQKRNTIQVVFQED